MPTPHIDPNGLRKNEPWWIAPYRITLKKRTTLGGHLATDHIGSVLVQRARKWDRDHKQIQTTAIALEIAADQLCKLNIAIGSGSESNTKAVVLLETCGEKLLPSEKNTTSRLAPSWRWGGNNQTGICIVSKGMLDSLTKQHRPIGSIAWHPFVYGPCVLVWKSIPSPLLHSVWAYTHVQIWFCSFRWSLGLWQLAMDDEAWR